MTIHCDNAVVPDKTTKQLSWVASALSSCLLNPSQDFFFFEGLSLLVPNRPGVAEKMESLSLKLIPSGQDQL